MLVFGPDPTAIDKLEIATDANGVVIDDRLKNRTWIASEQGQLLNTALGVNVDTSAGKLDTGRDGVRTITFYIA